MRYMLATLALGSMRQKRRLLLIQDENKLCSESQGSIPLKKLQNDYSLTIQILRKETQCFP